MKVDPAIADSSSFSALRVAGLERLTQTRANEQDGWRRKGVPMIARDVHPLLNENSSSVTERTRPRRFAGESNVENTPVCVMEQVRMSRQGKETQGE